MCELECESTNTTSMVEHPATCERCYELIHGIRYRCTACPDWDYCGSCYQHATRMHPMHPMHRFAEYVEPEIIYRATKSTLSASSLGNQTIAIDPDRATITEMLRRFATTGLYDHSQGPRFFEYSPLPDQNSFRLLALMPRRDDGILRCKTVHVSFDDAVAFEALSYSRGDQRQRAIIMVENSEFCVTESLQQILRRLEPTEEPRYLWVDAICIDQLDDTEKSAQVQRMRDIYTKAEKVLFWLGETADDSDALFDAINKGPDDHFSSAALVALFQRPCWGRVWCLQELSVPEQPPLVMCGDKTTDWDKLKAFCETLSMSSMGESSILSDPGALHHYRAMNRFWNYAGIRKMRHKASRVPLELLLLSSGMLRASDPRDFVYGLVGLATDTKDFIVDYTQAVSQVFTRAAQHIIQSSGRLNILYLRTGLVNSKVSPPLPTWVPDWTWRDAPPAIGGHSLYNASGGHPASVLFDGNRMRTAGTFFDIVERVSDPVVFTQDLENVLDVIVGFEKMVREHISGRVKEGSGLDVEELVVMNTHPRATDKFWRTLICDKAVEYGLGQTMEKSWSYKNAPADFGHRYEILRYGDSSEKTAGIDASVSLLSDLPPGLPEDFQPDLPREERIEQYTWPLKRILLLLSGRRFFITKRGDMGVAHANIRVGDRLSVLLGSDIPFALRSRGDETEPFQFIGEAYVHCAMRGEKFVAAAKSGLVYLISIE